MQFAANRASAVARARTAEGASHQLIGLLIISLFPAAFWTALIAGVGSVIGHSPSLVSLMTFGAAVAAFLAAVGYALIVRS